MFQVIADSEQDETCLNSYCKAWTDYQLSSRLLNAVAKYLNRQTYKIKTDGITVDQIAIDTWCKHLFTNLNKKLSEASLRMLERSRYGQDINSTAIKAVVETYLNLDVLKHTDMYDFDEHLQVNLHKIAAVLKGFF